MNLKGKVSPKFFKYGSVSRKSFDVRDRKVKKSRFLLSEKRRKKEKEWKEVSSVIIYVEFEMRDENRTI